MAQARAYLFFSLLIKFSCGENESAPGRAGGLGTNKTCVNSPFQFVSPGLVEPPETTNIVRLGLLLGTIGARVTLAPPYFSFLETE